MAEILQISDPADPLLDDYRVLREPERRENLESARGVCLVEGLVAIGTLLASGRPLRSLVVLERELERLRPLVARIDAPVLLVERGVLEAATGVDLHRGAIAACERFTPPTAAGVLARSRRVAVLEELADPANVGAIFRCAAALGIDAVLLGPRCGDPLTRRVIRVSSGLVLTLPWARLDALPAGLAPLGEAGFTTIALTPDPAAEPIDALAPRPEERLALLLGAEGPGLTAATLAACDRRVRIPLRSGVDSLNVAVAAGIAFQRLGRP